MLTSHNLTAQLNKKLAAFARVTSPLHPHFKWYRFYRIVHLAGAADARQSLLTLLCARHQVTFTSRGRHLFYQGDQQKSQFCQACHYEFANDGKHHKKLTKLKDIILPLSQTPALGFIVSEHELIDSEQFVKNGDKRSFTCRHCREMTLHSVNNMKTHINTQAHLACQYCDAKRKGKKSYTLAYAQAKVKQHTIDAASYHRFSERCIHTCLSCGQRHFWTPQQAVKAICTRCGTNGGFPLPVMPTLDDLGELITQSTTWQLSTAAAHEVNNAALFAQRFALPEHAKIHIACQRHPDYTRHVDLKSLQGRLQRNPCMRCAAEHKSQYTATLLEEAFIDVGVNLCIALTESALSSREQFIPSQHLLTLYCPEHGILPEKYHPYSLIRYARSYQSNTPCRQCSPDSGNTLNSPRLRYFVESTERIKTHGAQYRLLDSDTDIDSQIAAIKAAGEVPQEKLIMRLELLNMVEHPILPTSINSVFSISYPEFRKGKRGFMRPSYKVCWIAKFLAYFNVEWQLELQSEVSFAGLESEIGTPLRIDFYQANLHIAIEADGIQHVSENQQIHAQANREERFEKQVRRDEAVDRYFEAHHSLTLIRLKAYQPTLHDGFKALAIDEQYEIACQAASDIYQSLYHRIPPMIDREALLITAIENTK